MNFEKNRILNRKYKSETNLTDLSRNSEIVKKPKYVTDVEIFTREPIQRSFSDAILSRGSNVTKHDHYKLLDDTEFLQIDSNYNDAIEEVEYAFFSFLLLISFEFFIFVFFYKSQ